MKERESMATTASTHIEVAEVLIHGLATAADDGATVAEVGVLAQLATAHALIAIAQKMSKS